MGLRLSRSGSGTGAAPAPQSLRATGATGVTGRLPTCTNAAPVPRGKVSDPAVPMAAPGFGDSFGGGFKVPK